MRRGFGPVGAAARFRRAGTPSGSQAWRETGWCAVDLELTGLDPRRDEIIALGAVPIDGGRVVLGGARYTLVRPTHAPSHDAVLVHKLRLADLADAPPIEYAVDLLLETLAGRVPVFHTAAIERAFLTPLLANRRVRLPAAADTEVLGRAWLGQRDGRGPQAISLGRLTTELGIPAEPPHHALGDALTTAQVFVALASHLDRSSPQTVSSLAAAVPRTGAFRRF